MHSKVITSPSVPLMTDMWTIKITSCDVLARTTPQLQKGIAWVRVPHAASLAATTFQICHCTRYWPRSIHGIQRS